MAVNKNFRAKALVNLYYILDSSMENFKEEHSLKELDVLHYSDLVQTYVKNGLTELLVVEIENGYSGEYLTQLATFGSELLGMIKDNLDEEYDAIVSWQEIYNQMIQKVEKWFGGKVKMWVNVYQRTREFGGHEEGGWWYDWDTCVERRYVDYDQAELYEKMLSEKYGEGEGDISSVRGGHEYFVMIEDLEAESESVIRPHYS